MSENKNIDEKVLKLWNTVKEKQKEIEKTSEKHKWETSATFGFDPDIVANRVNIMTVTDNKILVRIISFLMIQRDYWALAATEIGVKSGFKWMGYSFDQWKADLRARAGQLSINEKRAELQELERRLNALITTEQRRELELAELEKLVQ